MLQPSSMLNRLDMETRLLHAEVDSYWLDLLAIGVTRDQYRRQLARIYGFEAPLESALAYTPHLIIADRRERGRTGLLALDLLALGVTPSRITALPQCGDIAPFDDPAEALGWKYVAERPTQLHPAIKRNVISQIAELENATAYLSACDGVASTRWQQLGVLLDEVSTRPRAKDRIIEAACNAFTTLNKWFRTSGEHAAVSP
jgi:heme oxygenase